MGSRPEEDCTERVESETHNDRELVALAAKDLSSDRGEEEVTATEVHDLETSRLEPCNTEHILEMLVQDIEKTVRETPEEEEGCNQDQREDQSLSSKEPALHRGGIHGNAAARHLDETSTCRGDVLLCGRWDTKSIES